MAEDVEAVQEKPPNTCCAALKKQHSKLLEKHSKVVEIRNQLRDAVRLVNKNYDVSEKENEGLRKALEELKVQANVWKDEKQRECGRCADLEDEVSALNDEVRLLKQNGNTASQAADNQIQEHLNAAQKEIKQLKELLGKERGQTALEKKNVELQKKRADEALKKVDMEKKNVELEKKKADEALKKLEMEKKNAELEKKKADEALKKVEMVKKHAELEKKKANEGLKKVEMEKKNVSEAQKVANVERKKAEEKWEKLKLEFDSLKSNLASDKSKCEDAEKKLEVEKQKVSRERKRADLAVTKFEEQRRLAETNLSKAMIEKERADDLSRKLEEARNRMKKLEGSHESSCNEKLEKMLFEKEADIIRERKRADSKKKKAKEQKKVAEAHQKAAAEQKHRADQISRELESYKLRLEELQKKQEFVSYRTYADNASLSNNDVISEIGTVKLLKKQLKLEKMVVKHAQKASKVEAVRNKMLHQEIFNLKQECLSFQQRLDMLDKSFLHDSEGIHKLGKIDSRISTRETLFSDGYNSQVISGIHSRLGPPYRGSSQNMLQNSAIYSSSASFSDRPLAGSQERGTFSITTSAELGEDVSNLEPTIPRLSDKMKTRRNEHDAVAKADNNKRSPIKINSDERRVGYSGRKRILDAVESIENLYSKGEKLHQRVSEELSVLNSLFSSQEDEPVNQNLKDTSCRKLARPSKKRKTSSEQIITGHYLQDSQEPKSILDPNIDHSDACMRASPSRYDARKSDWCFKDGKTHLFGSNQCIPQDFDYMKLLDLDNADDESAFRRAIDMPLSPLLPEFEFHWDKTLEVDNHAMLVDQSFQEELPNTKEKLGTSDVSDSGNRESNVPCRRGIVSTHGVFVKYLVIPSDNRDNSSILRILQTVDSCTPLCFFLHPAEIFLPNILHTLLKAEDLSMKEKVSVFLSLILHGISEFGMKNLASVSSDNFTHSLDAVTLHIRSALSDPYLRKIFMESCEFVELFAVIEDFFLQRKLLVRGDVYAEREAPLGSKINLVLNGDSITLSEVLASPDLLVAGGSLLASLCSAVDHIGFVCEISCNIISIQKLDPAVMLAVLHVFAHICGPKYFALEQYSLAMTVVKSVVMFLEKQTLPIDSTSFSPLSKIRLCSSSTICPFLEGAVSVEDVALLLLENLHKCEQSHGERAEEGSYDENFCDSIDILSLVEILASFMGWGWTFDHMIGQICEYLESHLMEGFSAAIFVLLGQLGRLGVGASGYEDPGVTNLRGRLSTFVLETTFSKLNFSVQFAIITCLLGLTAIKFEDIIEGKVETASVTSQSIPASLVREWFSHLGREQQSQLLLHQVANDCSFSD
ncbi:hypothetical protein ABFX02_13G088300 [Erythranthe guttata]